MNVQDFIPRIEAAGFTLEADGADIVVRPFSRLTDSQRQFIKAHKPELLAILTGKAGGSQSEPAPAPAPLDDAQLADLIASTATANGHDPLTVWRWLEREDIEALRSGDPAEIRAFRAMVALPRWDSTPPAVPHDLPFPGDQGTAEPAHQGDADAGRVVCGDCRNFERDRIGDGSGIGRCAVLDDPPGGLLYPKIDRRCSRFEAMATSTDTTTREATP